LRQSLLEFYTALAAIHQFTLADTATSGRTTPRRHSRLFTAREAPDRRGTIGAEVVFVKIPSRHGSFFDKATAKRVS
jgi:hypothetical protein